MEHNSIDMDAQLTSIVETGLISVLLSSIGTGIILYFAKRRLKQALFDGIYEFLGDFTANKDNPDAKVIMEQVSGLFNAMAIDLIGDMLSNVQKEPEKFIALVKPAINVLINDFMKDMPKGAQEAVASGGLSAIAPLLPKKLQKYAGLLQFFTGMGGNPSTAQTTTSTASPFSK